MKKRSLFTLAVALTVGVLATRSLAGQAVPGLGNYVYDPSGNITRAGEHVFRYDAFGRLQRSELGTFGTQSYVYDRYGNILKIVRNDNDHRDFTVRMSVDPMSNQIDLPYNAATNDANRIGVYDPAGNLIQHQGHTYVYDALNVMKETTDSARRLHVYSASDERVAVVQVENNLETTSEWTLRDASSRVLRRVTKNAAGAWQWKEDYVYAGGRLLAAAVPGPERVRHFHLDHLGTPRLITGNGGVRLAEKTYEPFGPKASAATGDFEQLEFTGHERDASTLDYMHARYYQPELGRFLSVDPVRNDRLATPQAWNRYSYALNSPILRIDPDGRKDTIYWLQSFNWREARGAGGVVQAAVANRNHNVQVTYFASRSDIMSTLARAEATDIVVVQSHSSRAGMRESGFFGPKALVTGADMATAVASDSSRPDAVILAGCSTDRVAETVASRGGVPAIGTTSGVGIGVGTDATGVMIWSLLGGATAQGAAANGNQHLQQNPVRCEPYPCDGEFRAYEGAPAERDQ